MEYFKRYFRSGFCSIGGLALATSSPGWAQAPVIQKIEVRPADRSGLSNRDMQNICTAAIATLFEQPAAIINLDGVEQGTMHLSSASPADDRSRRYACQLQGQKIIWARLDDGRQGDHPDGQASFQLTGDEILITVKFPDGSEKERRFPR